MTSASLKSLRVTLGAADADVDMGELPWSIPGIEPLGAVELEADVPLLQPATVRAAAVAVATMTVLIVNMVVFLCEVSKEVESDRFRPATGHSARPRAKACQTLRIDSSERERTVQGGAR
jgi:hypothetical protein